ncbi:MAG: M23 family metallopeptidase, partial [Thermodesulfobacteriota bacterium]|nr:M23 family metallopeptidase [Thermodesulfobacteriota bacterium]
MLRNRKTHLISLFLLLFITACTTTNKPGGVYHCVKKGDTLWKISQLYNCKSSELAEVNNLPDTNIEAGSVLFIPYATNAMSTKPGKTPSNKTHDTVKPKTSSTVQKGSRKNIKKDEPSASKNVRLKSAPVNKSSKPSLIWPANGKVSSKFGTYNGMRHNGIQIKGKDGSSVLASANGAVIHSANIKYYGETIIIKHSST